MPRFANLATTARTVGGVHTNTVKLWAGNGFFTTYQAADGSFLFDLDEVLQALETNPRMRDKRQPFGPKARVVPLPPTAKIVKPIPRAEVVLPSTPEANS